MAITPVPSMTDTPEFPSLADRAAGTYNSKAYEFGTHMANVFNAELEAVAESAYNNALAAEQSVTDAETAAADAESAATSAASTAGATKWISGTYTEGAAVWSPTDGQTYRRKAPGGASPTDPAADPTNWNMLGSQTTLTDKTLVRPVSTSPRYTRDDDGTITGGTWAIDYANGPVIKGQAGAAITSITMSNWPATGTAGHLRLMLVNFGAYTITFPAWKWVKSDLTTTTTFADLSLDLPASGAAFIDLFSDDGGTNIYATIARN